MSAAPDAGSTGIHQNPDPRTTTALMLRGALGVALGLATVFWPREGSNPFQLTIGVSTVDLVLITYLLISAVLLVWHSRLVTGILRTALLGQAVVVAPAVVFLFLAEYPGQLRAAVCIWAVLHGLLELWIYRINVHRPMSSDFLIAGGAHFLLGVVLGFGADMSALTVFGFTGAATLIAGVVYLIGGYTHRARARSGDTADTRADAHPAESGEPDPDIAGDPDTTSGAAGDPAGTTRRPEEDR